MEPDHTKWQNTWKIVPSTLQYVKEIWNWFPLSGKIDGHWHAHNRISNRSDAPLLNSIKKWLSPMLSIKYKQFSTGDIWWNAKGVSDFGLGMAYIPNQEMLCKCHVLCASLSFLTYTLWWRQVWTLNLVWYRDTRSSLMQQIICLYSMDSHTHTIYIGSCFSKPQLSIIRPFKQNKLFCIKSHFIHLT